MENRKIPSPGGRGGGSEHKGLIKRVINKILGKGSDFDTEVLVNTSKGKRFADIAEIDSDGNVIEYHQIGKQNKNGTPVARERRAIEEIEKATGKKVFFHPYNIMLLLLVALGMVLAFS